MHEVLELQSFSWLVLEIMEQTFKHIQFVQPTVENIPGNAGAYWSSGLDKKVTEHSSALNK